MIKRTSKIKGTPIQGISTATAKDLTYREIYEFPTAGAIYVDGTISKIIAVYLSLHHKYSDVSKDIYSHAIEAFVKIKQIIQKNNIHEITIIKNSFVMLDNFDQFEKDILEIYKDIISLNIYIK